MLWVKQDLFPFSLTERFVSSESPYPSGWSRVCLPRGLQAPVTQEERGTYRQQKGYICFWLYSVTSVRLSRTLTELQISASGSQLMSDIVCLLIVQQPLTQITLSLTLTSPESGMSINGGIYPVPQSTSGVW